MFLPIFGLCTSTNQEREQIQLWKNISDVFTIQSSKKIWNNQKSSALFNACKQYYDNQSKKIQTKITVRKTTDDKRIWLAINSVIEDMNDKKEKEKNYLMLNNHLISSRSWMFYAQIKLCEFRVNVDSTRTFWWRKAWRIMQY